MKANETREETLTRLAKDARKGASAHKRFTALVKRVTKTQTPAAKTKTK